MVGMRPEMGAIPRLLASPCSLEGRLVHRTVAAGVSPAKSDVPEAVVAPK